MSLTTFGWTVFAQNMDTAVPAEGNGDLQTLICVLVARPRRCPTLSHPVPWQNWMAAYLGYTLWMKTLFRGWPVIVHDTHTRRRRIDYFAGDNEIYLFAIERCSKGYRYRHLLQLLQVSCIRVLPSHSCRVTLQYCRYFGSEISISHRFWPWTELNV